MLEKLGLAKLIKENKFENINILVELINKNKLSYDKAILEALCEIQIDLAVTYSLKLEREDNVGNFFGQNLFLAAGGLLLIKGVMEQLGYSVELTDILMRRNILVK